MSCGQGQLEIWRYCTFLYVQGKLLTSRAGEPGSALFAGDAVLVAVTLLVRLVQPGGPLEVGDLSYPVTPFDAPDEAYCPLRCALAR